MVDGTRTEPLAEEVVRTEPLAEKVVRTEPLAEGAAPLLVMRAYLPTRPRC